MTRHLNQLAHLCEELKARLGADDAMYLQIKSEMEQEVQKKGLAKANSAWSSSATYPAFLPTLISGQAPEVHH